jgi:hypothetical protein
MDPFISQVGIIIDHIDSKQSSKMNGSIDRFLSFCFFMNMSIDVLSFGLASSGTIINANPLTSPYTTALTCSLPNRTRTAATSTLLATHANTHTPLSLSSFQQAHHQRQQQQQQQQHSAPYVFLSTSSDDGCFNNGGTSILSGKTGTLSSPSALYFYNGHNNQGNMNTSNMYSADFLRL